MQFNLFQNEELLPIPLDRCLELYFSGSKYARTREALCMMHHVDEGILKDWCEAFNLQQIMRGDTEKTIRDYTRHLMEWIKFQDTSKDPKTIFNVERNTNNRAGNSKMGKQSIQSAFDKIDRMSD